MNFERVVRTLIGLLIFAIVAAVAVENAILGWAVLRLRSATAPDETKTVCVKSYVTYRPVYMGKFGGYQSMPVTECAEWQTVRNPEWDAWRMQHEKLKEGTK